MSLMLAEIAEQPAALERTIAEERAKITKLGNVLKSRNIDLIVLVARGSSDNAALFGRYLLEITTGIPVSLSAPSVYTIYNAQLKLDHALVVGVSQSGEGEDINRVLESAKRSGAYTVGILTIGLAIFMWPLLGVFALGIGLGDTWLDWRNRPRPTT